MLCIGTPLEAFDLEELKKKIDDYIQKKVDVVLDRRIRNYFDGLLIAEAHKFMRQRLDKYIEDMVRNSIDGALRSLAEEFEIDAEHFDNEEISSTSTAVIPSETNVGLDGEALQLLALLQVYEERKQGTPSTATIYKYLGFEDDRMVTLYRQLQEDGWIDRPFVDGKRQTLLLKKLVDPENVLSSVGVSLDE